MQFKDHNPFSGSTGKSREKDRCSERLLQKILQVRNRKMIIGPFIQMIEIERVSRNIQHRINLNLFPLEPENEPQDFMHMGAAKFQ